MDPRFIQKRTREIQRENPSIGYLNAMQQATDEWLAAHKPKPKPIEWSEFDRKLMHKYYRGLIKLD